MVGNNKLHFLFRKKNPTDLQVLTSVINDCIFYRWEQERKEKEGNGNATDLPS
jgi:hypothetical protein